jgi:uncharacterized protein
MRALRASLRRIPRALFVLVPLQLALIAALVFSLSEGFHLSSREANRAANLQQRIVIDAATGKVISPVMPVKDASVKPDSSYDVAPKESQATPAPTDDSEAQSPSADQPVVKKEGAPNDALAKEATEPTAPEKPTSPDNKVTESKTLESAPPEKKPSETPVAKHPEEEASTSDQKKNTESSAASQVGNKLISPNDAPALDTGEEPLIAPIARTNKSLVAAPALEVSDRTDKGILPKINGADVTPAKVYARPYIWPEKEPKPSVALVVVGLGLNARSMEEAFSLPSAVALSFSPYGASSAQWIDSARNKGHEIWMDLPAEESTSPYSDPGAYGVVRGLDTTAVVAHMHEAMMKFSGYVGMALPLKQTILGESSVAVPMLDELQKRGLFVIVPSTKTTLDSMSHLAPYLTELLLADVVIDASMSKEVMESRFSSLEENAKEKAKEHGVVFVVVDDTPSVIRAVTEWTKTLKKKKIKLVPPSALIFRTQKENAVKKMEVNDEIKNMGKNRLKKDPNAKEAEGH